jgi:hypothetical protein
MDLLYRTLGVVGTLGGSTALLVFAGVMGDEPGNVSLLVLGIVFLAVGVPSLVTWIRTL